MPLSGRYTASRNVRKSDIKKGDKLIFISTHPYAAPDGDTYYSVSVYRDGKRLPFDSITVTHKELTGRKDQR